MPQLSLSDQDISDVYLILGGRPATGKPVRNVLDAHDMLEGGVPPAALLHLTSQFTSLGAAGVLEQVFGIRSRAFQRRLKGSPGSALSVDQSNRVWIFAAVLSRASKALGSNAAAEAWLFGPAIGLSNRRPIDLLRTPAGLDAVGRYLTQIEYGVYV